MIAPAGLWKMLPARLVTSRLWSLLGAQGLLGLTDRLSIQKAIAMRLPYEPPAPEKSKSSFSRMLSSKSQSVQQQAQQPQQASG